ncbi:hypothetical protein Lalb_Chr00c46g0412731 [Lupinus albus]|uniref:Uncharacterized protein n=1 Tax=Lupinus albus TaxID=3870 RepID=A0A6A4N9L6_LUPAL|nr:hypothetical protein Lalb_Chr00c46g0412731 [Lupinus albus]
MEGISMKMMMLMMIQLLVVISITLIGMGSAQPSRCSPGQCPRFPDCCGFRNLNNITK